MWPTLKGWHIHKEKYKGKYINPQIPVVAVNSLLRHLLSIYLNLLVIWLKIFLLALRLKGKGKGRERAKKNNAAWALRPDTLFCV